MGVGVGCAVAGGAVRAGGAVPAGRGVGSAVGTGEAVPCGAGDGVAIDGRADGALAVAGARVPSGRGLRVGVGSGTDGRRRPAPHLQAIGFDGDDVARAEHGVPDARGAPLTHRDDRALGQQQPIGVLEHRPVGKGDLDVDRPCERQAQTGRRVRSQQPEAERGHGHDHGRDARRRDPPANRAATAGRGRRHGRQAGRNRAEPILEGVGEVGVRRLDRAAPGLVETAAEVIAHERDSSSRARRSARVARWTTTAIVAFDVPRAAAASSGVSPARNRSSRARW